MQPATTLTPASSTHPAWVGLGPIRAFTAALPTQRRTLISLFRPLTIVTVPVVWHRSALFPASFTTAGLLQGRGTHSDQLGAYSDCHPSPYSITVPCHRHLGFTFFYPSPFSVPVTSCLLTTAFVELSVTAQLPFSYVLLFPDFPFFLRRVAPCKSRQLV